MEGCKTQGILRRKGLQAGAAGMWPGGRGAVLEVALQWLQAKRDEFVRDQGIEKRAVEGSEDCFAQAAGDACHLGMPAKSDSSIPIRR
jgi:hypothetical protein